MNTPKGPTKRSVSSLYRTLNEEEALDDLDALAAMTDGELNDHIRSQGGDPEAIAAAGAALVAGFEGRKERHAWHTTMDQKIERVRESVTQKMARRERRPRAELLERLAVARMHPSLSAPVAALFQKKSPEASTDEELETLLAQIELLADIEEP